MTTIADSWTERSLRLADGELRLLQGGSGPPLLVLHRDTGSPGWIAAYDSLARQFTVLVPNHPGFGRSERLAWLRSPRDLAALYQWLLADLNLSEVALLGLGFGGWIAAEMASLAPRDFRSLVLVGAMGIRPSTGEIFDQALVNYIDYARAGFHDQAAFERQYGAEPDTDQLVAWDLCREMSFRLAWKPYMYSQTLPNLLGGVRAPSLVVWGAEDRIVPLSAGRRYVEALPNARLEVVPDCGHCVDLERPDVFAGIVAQFISVS